MDPNSEPRLAPPGAGLPKLELAIGRILFCLRRLTGNRDSFTRRFHEEREAIRRLVSTFDAASAGRRVLIERPRGLEDSSRWWSAWMTLDHLHIVNRQITKIVGALIAGTVPPGKASTANVKPGTDVAASVVGEWEKSCDALLATVAAAPDLKTRVRFVHPWFGPLDASGWHALAGGHMGLHRVQIERISAKLHAERT